MRLPIITSKDIRMGTLKHFLALENLNYGVTVFSGDEVATWTPIMYIYGDGADIMSPSFRHFYFGTIIQKSFLAIMKSIANLVHFV